MEMRLEKETEGCLLQCMKPGTVPQHAASPTDKASLCHGSVWDQSRLLPKLYNTDIQLICVTVKY